MTTSGLDIAVAHASDQVRSNIVDNLNDRHHVTGTAGTIAEMKQMVHEQQPQLLVTGVMFVDGSGIDACIELGQERPMPIVIATAARSLELVQKAMEDHVMAYLIEPIICEDLEASIIVAWNRFQQLRELQDQVDDMKLALQHRKVVERAKGMLMAAEQLTEAEAFSKLRSEAQNTRRRLVDIAEDILAREAPKQT